MQVKRKQDRLYKATEIAFQNQNRRVELIFSRQKQDETTDNN